MIFFSHPFLNCAIGPIRTSVGVSTMTFLSCRGIFHSQHERVNNFTRHTHLHTHAQTITSYLRIMLRYMLVPVSC